jgi:hypothetical protein
MAGPSEHSLNRLRFIRALYLRAVDTASQPEPIGALSVLGFHDAVELFLHLAADHLNVPLKSGVTFAGYWGPIDEAIPGDSTLSGRVAMRQLNQVRVGLKHHGALPAHSSIEGHRAATTSFLESNTPLVFDGVAFGKLDMV